ncbi:MAG: hypothetical protein WBA93_09595 [Microcoleaceae cyanobacterium]
MRITILGDSLVWSGEKSSGKLYAEVLDRNFNNLGFWAFKQT